MPARPTGLRAFFLFIHFVTKKPGSPTHKKRAGCNCAPLLILLFIVSI